MDKKIESYDIIKTLQKNGENANVYLVQDKLGEKFVIKEFNKSVKPYIGYAKYNHYGRRREGSESIFDEIKAISKSYNFLIKFHRRLRWNNKWCIIIEYIDGETLGNFIKNNKDNESLVASIIKEFAKEVSKWHSNNFALGDPHLENVIVEKDHKSLKLIDYSQIHHPSFYCCQKFNCFKPTTLRIKQDLKNDTGKFGKGFLMELDLLKNNLKMNLNLSKIFMDNYFTETTP